MSQISKNILDCFLSRFSYGITKRIFQFSSLSCLILFFVLPFVLTKGQYGWFIVSLFIFEIFLAWLLHDLREHYGLTNNDSDVINEAKNNLYKYFDEVTSRKKYVMIQPKEIYPSLKELLEKEKYSVYFECDRYAVYEKKD